MQTIKPNSDTYSDDFSSTIRPGNISSTVRPSSLTNGDMSSTIRPNGESSTIRPTNFGMTIRPGELNNDDTEKTVRPGDDKTIDPNKMSSTASLNDKIDTSMYQPRDSYTINGIEYRVIKPLSLTSGEAQVFLVEDPSKVEHVLKLYYKGSTPDTTILDIVKQANGASTLFKELSHGTFEDRYFELIEYYNGDNLDTIDVRKKESEIINLIKFMAKAIDFCHELGFIHRDVKPSNFVFEDKGRKNLLLGDFGIAVKHDKKGECVADMARTKIFAAPEVYLNTGDGKAKFSTKSDFYSLGITIIYLWMGRDQFTHFEKENELQLATLKAYGNMPIPGDMPPRLQSLVKALIEPNPTKRAGYDEVQKWLTGENPFKTEVQSPTRNQFKVIFSGERNLIAYSPEELARIMFDNQQLAISYLYKGRVTRWLEDNGRPELAIEMERIKEDLYPTNTTAGLDAACYILHPSMPFIDICGNNCKTSTEIAKSILSNFDKYLMQLSNNPTSRLIVFLQTHGLESAVVDFRKEFANDKRLGLLYLAYKLDANLPWRMTDVDGQEGVFDSGDEILNWVSEYAASDRSLSDIVSNAFLLWISQRNTITAAAIQPLIKRQGDINNSYGVLYRLNPAVGLYFILDKTSPNYLITIEKLAQLINKCLTSVINKTDENGWDAGIIQELYEISQGQKPSIYHFLESKGAKYAEKIKWIKYCLDLKSEDNTKKAGPYNDLIGLFKIVKGMNGKASYTFKSGKTIDNPSELSTVSSADLNDAKANPYHPVEAWVSVFYQEDPNLDKNIKYTYERKTAEYMEFLSSQGFSSPEIGRYNSSKQIVESRAMKLRSTLSIVKKGRLVVSLITLIPLCVAALLLAFVWRPEFGSLRFDSVFTPVAVILTIVFCFMTGFAGKIIGEIIWGCIVGAIISYIIVYLSKFTSTITPYAAAAIVAALGMYFYTRCIGIKLKEKENDELLHPDFEHLELEPLHEAYHPNFNGFDSSIGDETNNYSTYLSQINKTMWRRAVPVGIITVLSILYFMNIGPIKSIVNNSNVTEKLSSYGLDSKPDFSNGLYGSWSGTINNEPALVRFETMEKRYIAKMIIEQSGLKREFIGYYHVKRGLLEDLKINGSEKVSGALNLVDNKLAGVITINNQENYIDLEYVPGTE